MDDLLYERRRRARRTGGPSEYHVHLPFEWSNQPSLRLLKIADSVVRLVRLRTFVGELVYPRNSNDTAKAAKMKAVWLSFLLFRQCPCLAAVVTCSATFVEVFNLWFS